ncbi:MAG: TRAP transporter small permease subunit [Propylenella sp.]
MRSLVDLVDAVNIRIGRAVAWLVVAMMLLQVLVVICRYVFGIGSIQVQESIQYMHAFLFMLASAYTLAFDGHVRVDIFYREASARRRALVNLVGALVFLIPVCILLLLISWRYVGRSWAILEGSHETSGIPGVFLLKTVIPVFAVQMGLQGIVMAVRSALALAGDRRELERLDGSAAAELA